MDGLQVNRVSRTVSRNVQIDGVVHGLLYIRWHSATRDDSEMLFILLLLVDFQ